MPMIDVDCEKCAHKIGEYSGPLGPNIPIRSQFYKRIDGTKPIHGSSTAWPCPYCKETVNELICVMNAVVANMKPTAETLHDLVQMADPEAKS